MPEMDGIELTKRIRSELAATKIIILSAYIEFEYAREALKYGASGYLLKPEVEFEDLLEAMIALREEVENERIQSDKLKEAWYNERQARKSSELRRALSGEEELLGSYLHEANLVVAVMTSDNESETQRVSDDTLREIESVLTRSGLRAVAVSKDKDNKEIVCLFNRRNYESSAVLQAFVDIQNELKASAQSDFSIGVSLIGNGFKQVQLLYGQAKRAVEGKFYGKPGGIYYWDAGRSADVRSIQQYISTQKLLEVLYKGNWTELHDMLVILFAQLSTRTFLVPEDIKTPSYGLRIR
jgi:Response regulator containing CheY-like receiver domain and AraC-type DNA-binding domain